MWFLPEVMFHRENVVFPNLIFIGNGIVMHRNHQIDLIWCYDPARELQHKFETDHRVYKNRVISNNTE